MSGAIDRIRNGQCETDLDGLGHRLINWNTDNLIFGQFGPQLANRLYAGPASGSAAIPTFRIVTAAEVGAQPHSAGLDILSPITPSEPGLNFLTLAIPVTSGYTRVQRVGGGTIVSVLTAAQLRTDIQAQPLSDGLTLLSPLSPTFTGMGMLIVPDPIVAGYPKHNGADSGQPWSFLTPAQLLADIGAGTGGSGGSGQGDDLNISAAQDVTLAPADPYIQWFQRVVVSGAASNYALNLILIKANAAKGAIFRIRLEFSADCIATAQILGGKDSLVVLRSVTGQTDLGASVFVSELEFNGDVWREVGGYYVI